jgi:branched-chain amino acid transport system permease protein
LVQYLIAGIVIGSVYAIASTGLVITYRSSGILNFGYGGLAFFVALLYYYLNTEHGWPIWAAALVSIGLVAPALGCILYVALFRFLKTSTSLIKIVATIGLGVALPPLAYLLLGTPPPSLAPGLAPEPVWSYKVFGAAVSLNQIIVVICLLVILAVGYVVLRFTEVGLLIRATVDSPALTSLAGGSPAIVSFAVCATTTLLAGLAGVLLAPLVSLDPVQYELLIAAAFTSVLIAKLTNVGRALVVSLALGVASSIAEYLLPPTSPITSGVIAATPFVFVLLFLLWEVRRNEVSEDVAIAGKLDQAIAPVNASKEKDDKHSPLVLRLHYSSRKTGPVNGRVVGGIGSIVVVALLPVLLSGYWTQQVAAGMCFAVIFLSFTLVTGEGGMIWLCEAAFAGLGAVFTAQLATSAHFPVLLALLVAALLVAPIGFVIALLTTRLGDLYVVLATLAFGILVDNVVLILPVFSGTGGTGAGVALAPPSFATGSTGFIYMTLAVFCVIAVIIEHYRRSTVGLVMSAVSWSTRGAKSTGASVTHSKVTVATAAAVVAAIGGGLLAMDQGHAVPASYNTSTGLVWLAVLATVGIRSNVSAVVAGLVYAIAPALFQTYLPLSLAQIPAAAFGLGAIMLVRNPDGAVAMNVRQIRALFTKRVSRVETPPVLETSSS